MKRLGLRWSIAVAVWLAVVLSVTAASVFADRAVREGIRNSQDNSEQSILTLEMNLLASESTQGDQIGEVLSRWGLAGHFVARDGRWMPGEGQSIPIDDPCLPPLDEVVPAPTGPGAASGAPFRHDCEDWRVVGFWQNSRDTGLEAIVVFTGQADYSVADRLRRQLWWVGGLGGIVATLGAWWISGRLTAPIRRAGDFAARFGSGERDLRLPVEGRDETSRMSEQFNRMADEVSATLAAHQRFVADTAHELRTPTTALLAAADALENPRTRDRAVTLVAPQLRQLSQLTEDLLTLARFDSGRENLRVQKVVLRDLVEQIAGHVGCAPVMILDDADTPVSCDPVRVGIIIGNLLANALLHGALPVTVTILHLAARVEVLVRDEGEGVAASMRETIFDRFVQADCSRSTRGSGLGLAIAREQARLHGGDLTLDPDGRNFRLTLPAGSGASGS